MGFGHHTLQTTHPHNPSASLRRGPSRSVSSYRSGCWGVPPARRRTRRSTGHGNHLTPPPPAQISQRDAAPRRPAVARRHLAAAADPAVGRDPPQPHAVRQEVQLDPLVLQRRGRGAQGQRRAQGAGRRHGPAGRRAQRGAGRAAAQVDGQRQLGRRRLRCAAPPAPALTRPRPFSPRARSQPSLPRGCAAR